MNTDILLLWLTSALSGAGGVVALLLLVMSYAAEASLLAYPAARVHSAIAKKEWGARRLLYWLSEPQRCWLALVVLQSLLWTLLLTLLLHLGREVRWELLPEVAGQGTQAPSRTWAGFGRLFAFLATVTLATSCRLLGQLLGRSFARWFGPAALWLLAPLATLLGPALTGLLRAVAPLGLMPLGRAGPWQPSVRPGESPLSCGPFWTAEAVAEVTHAAHHENMGERGPDLFASLATFSDTIIREVMVPRTDVLSISLSASEEEVRKIMRETEHSRMPVYDDTIDHIVGLLHVKALVGSAPQESVQDLQSAQGLQVFDLAKLLRPTFYVPEVMKISALLREFQRRKTHLAIVVDEYGGTSGIVTLEDIIEEIVGEIHDEYDIEDKQFRLLGDDKILADAKANIWDLEQALGVPLSAAGEFETLGGFLLSLTGSLPARGAVVTYQDVRFTIKEATERRIHTVEIERRGPGRFAAAPVAGLKSPRS